MFYFYKGDKVKMKVVFVSNYYNHHQAPFSQAMSRLTNGKFWFIENEEISQERKNMGWGEKNIPIYVRQAYTGENCRRECIGLIDSADIVIFENTTRELVLDRLKAGKLTFLYSERYFKEGYEWWKLPIRLITWHKVFDRYKNHYLLCASAYTAADFALTLNYINKTYKWGYFPAVQKHEINELMEKKRFLKNGKEQVSILWAGRLIEFKHPEMAIYLAEKLREHGYAFTLQIIGNGKMEEKLRGMIQEKNLCEYVEMLGAMTPDKVREYMEHSNIFLFTSDFGEGWGAVLNESMNSGCAVVASHAIGSVPFLLENGKNGLIYQNGNEQDFFNKVEKLIVDSEFRKKLGMAAYKTMLETWNAEVAAERILKLSEDLMKNGKSDRFSKGPCSKAEILWNGWFKV